VRFTFGLRQQAAKLLQFLIQEYPNSPEAKESLGAAEGAQQEAVGRQ
jgi:hypothetical protein